MGTLWPIESAAGRLFSEAFYDTVAKADSAYRSTPGEEKAKVVNLAFAFREAILCSKDS